jgi:Phage tail sheath C-terminal domain
MATINLPIESPGVVIREFDFSITQDLAGATTVLLNGFAAQGPTDEPIVLNSLSQYEDLFGFPTTPAERYAHNAAQQILTTSDATLIFTRLPYGSGAGIGYASDYTALVYPVVAVSASEIDACDYYTNLTAEQVQERHPHLYNDYYLQECLGSPNLFCSVDATDFVGEDSTVFLFNYPAKENGKVSSFKFTYYETTGASDEFNILQLRNNGDSYDIVETFSLSDFGDGSYVNFAALSADDDGLKILDFSAGIDVLAGDVFAISAAEETFGLYATDSGNVVSLSALSGGDYVIEDAETTFDIQLTVCYDLTGISCEEVTALNLVVPEKYRFTFTPVGGECELRDANYYLIGDPVLKELNESEYELLKNRQFDWKCGCFSNVDANLGLLENDVRAGIILVNEKKTAQTENFYGYYAAITDNFNVNPATDFNEVTQICGKYDTSCVGISGSGWTPIPAERLNFPVSSAYDSSLESISSIIEQSSGLDYASDSYVDSITVSLFKLKPSISGNVAKLDYVLSEKFIGSLNAKRKIASPDGGRPRSFFIEDAVNENSNTLKVFVNPFLSENNCWTDDSGEPQKYVRSYREALGGVFESGFDAYDVLDRYADNLYTINAQSSKCVDERLESCKTKDIGSLPLKLERALRNVENPDVFDIDIILDAGLSTIWGTRQAVQSNACLGDVSVCYGYDDKVYVDTTSLSPYDGYGISSDIQDGWEVITNIFTNFAGGVTASLGGGSLFISDPLRQIFVNGESFKIIDRQKKQTLDPKTGQPSQQYSTFSRNIWTYLRNLYGAINSSYTGAYANWIKEYDAYSDKSHWFPISPYIAAMMARNDSRSYPWLPPFGASNGVITSGQELAINPNQKDRDLLYRININPIMETSALGRVVWAGQTLQKVDSALSKINVRRLLLALQKPTRRTLMRFIGEPNDIITRTRVVNAITPIMEEAKQNRGLYRYKIICDDSNNTNEDINNGVLKVAIYLEPIKGVEFILADFFITNTGVDFAELI